MSRLEKVRDNIYVSVPQWHDPIWNKLWLARRWVLGRTVCRLRGHDWRWQRHGWVSEHAEMPPPHVCVRCGYRGRSERPVPFT